ncbi:MAG: fibronectin type III-like domain-contianing protein, partial [Calditrichia bacterium]|nr:fibronectin type III-like domain-contianing protein [Calditrichia bacterium]
ESGKNLEITVDLKNTGEYEATEVVQLYTRDIAGSITRPVKELKGFKRISLKPEETREVKFKITAEDLAFYNVDMKFVTEPGKFEVMVGSSSDDESLLKSSFEFVYRE